MIAMEELSTLSVFLGYTSIACWLGAQFPQVLENIRRQSCEGLALPFLANWFLGDLSNLIGCLLTHQLPFQTYLATYFVCVDFMLLSQYIYYRRSKPPPPFGHIRSRTGTIRRLSSDRGAPRYRTLSAVAANVAAAAALAAEQDEQAEPRFAHSRWQRGSVDHHHEGSGSRVSRDTAGDDDDDDSLAVLADSFHSEGGRDSRRKRVSWSTERLGRRGGSVGRNTVLGRSTFLQSMQFTTGESPAEYIDPLHRGRSLQRDTDPATEAESDGAGTQRRSSRASRRGASLVFLGVWALFSVGTLTNSMRTFSPSGGASIGRVLSVRGLRIPNSPPVAVSDHPILHKPSNVVVPDDRPPYNRPHNPYPAQPSAERVLGRIFAWLCTTLYLTSRLPQIWKNFVRKSVEGLSMYLFIFAFLGNSFYVASILSSPKVYLPPPTSTEFIKESIPYLLGSAGTLVFDVTIVTQSFIYRRSPRRQASVRSRMTEEEEAGLLSRDALAHPHRGSSDSVAQSRGRTSSAPAIV